MFRFILTQTKKAKPKPLDLSATFSTVSRSKVSIHHCNLQKHNSSGRADRILDKRIPLKISNPLQTINFLFNHNYVTDAPNKAMRADELIKKEMDDVINEFNKKSLANGNRLFQYELKTLFNRIKTKKLTTEQALNILKLCSFGRTEQNVIEIVKDIWHELHSADHMNAHEFNTQHYNYILKFGSDQQDVNNTQEIFDQMIADGIEPNAISYEYLLSVYCKSGNMEKSQEILDMMEQNQLPLSECAYNYWIQCYIISGSVTDANKLIENVNKNRKRDERFKINRDTLTTLLIHYAKAHDLENCRKTFAFFETLNIELLNLDIFNVMCQFCINGHADQCYSLFKYIKSNAEMQAALHDATTSFVQNNQSRHFVEILEKLMSDGIVNDVRPAIYKHLIHEMCRHKTSQDEFEATIELIESNGFTMDKNFDSFKSALKSSSSKLIRRALSYMKANRMQVTEMQFEGLFELAATASTSAGLKEDDALNVINLMCVDFRIQPSTVYIRDVILPSLLNTTADANDSKYSIMAAADKLLNTKITHYRTLTALINVSLNRCDFKTAIQLMNSKKCFHAIKLITTPLLNAYASTGDVQSFVETLVIICRNFSNIVDYHPHELSDTEINRRKMAFIDEMLTAAVAHSLADEQRLCRLLEAFAKAKNELNISSNQVKKIQQLISESVNLNQMMNIDRSLKSLMSAKDGRKSSSDWDPTPAAPKQQRQHQKNAEHQSSAEIKRILNKQSAMGRDVTGTEKQLFLAYIREDNIAEVEAILSGQTTAAAKFSLTQANYGMLVKLYTRHGDLQKALNTLEQACKNDSSFKLNPIELAQLVQLMYEKDQFKINEVDALLHRHRPDKKLTSVNIPFERLLQRLATDGHTQYVQQLFDTLVKFHYIQATLETAGPLITVHLHNGAYDLAVQKYHDFGETYEFLPMSATLFKTLIQNKQNDLLQRVVKIHENLNGKSSAMSHLAFAYSACGQIEEAKEIFKSGQIDDLEKEIGKICMVYARRDGLESAKFLLKSTEGVLTYDRRIIYQAILDLYCKYDMTDAALELWLTMSNDDVLPTPKFLDKLAKLLQIHHIELPSDLKNKLKRQNC